MATPPPDIIGTALLEAFAQRGYAATLPDPMTVSVELPNGSSVSADITEWRRHAGRSSRAALPGIAAQYADQAATAFQRHDGPARNDQILSENLRLRLYTDETLGDMRDALVTRRLAPGLLETVVVDHPDALMPLNRSDVGGTPENSVFGTALSLSLGKEPHYIETVAVQGVDVMHIGGTHRYVSSQVHALRRHVEPASVPYGALVAFPLPEYVLVHPIGGAHLFAAMEAVQDLSRRLFEAGDKAISTQVFWWRPGSYERLPEEEALNSGQVPDLRPVGIQVDHRAMSVAAQSADTSELIDLWARDHG
ncbi:hypothetical protein [Actinomadura sp. HBU206391]|uniref:hypothetical protein n=1 Tax=Actinomadura sp. HBU206391 TaxID=2731692 RepID=UPI001650BD65|nr:hypothetical protein [Actinomadura sp. HBU206391]MBC6462074.1 hypothetical protein [Actinomadura sp. HBU206391]